MRPLAQSLDRAGSRRSAIGEIENTRARRNRTVGQVTDEGRHERNHRGTLSADVAVTR